MHAPIALTPPLEEPSICANAIDASSSCLGDASAHLTYPLLKVITLIYFFELFVIFDIFLKNWLFKKKYFI